VPQGSGGDARYLAVVEDSSEIVTLLDRRGYVVYVNPAGERLLGYDLAILRARALDFVHPEDVDRLRLDIATLLDAAGRHRFEFRMRHVDGTWHHLETVGRNMLDDEEVGAVVLHSLDITEQRDAERRLIHERLYDGLTGLPNRALFIEQLRRVLARAVRTRGTVAVLGVDMDHFNVVNEHHGFDAGDEVLRQVGRRLGSILRAYDVLARGRSLATRVGGDEFFVLCEDVPDARVAAAIAARVAAACGEPVRVEDGDVCVTATVGVALSGGVETNAEQLLVDAASAVQAGKEHGGARLEVFDENLRHEAHHRATQVVELRNAIDQGELRLLYQPKVEIASGQMIGVEALVRWEHSERGSVPPSEFIPSAEDAGLIDALGEWVLNEACRQRVVWESVLPVSSRLRVSVNVSSRQFNASFPDVVRRSLSETGVAPGSLCIEITESAVMNDVDTAITTLEELRGLGLEVSIDDFGTGFSSLAQLKRLPLDELKIDGSFVRGLGQDREDTAIVAAVVAMAHALDLSVTAEGVETRDQLVQLRVLGCELAQGFLFSPPVAADLIRDYLTAGDTHVFPAAGGAAMRTGHNADLVLVVDDAADVRRLARVSLAASGFDVIEAVEGREALSLARRVRPACVVLDVSMPGLSGFAVCRALRADPLTADCTVVMLTANAAADDKVEAFSAGADDYMVKPFAPRDITGRVRSAINRRRLNNTSGQRRDCDGRSH
jgi:diguanylate cyclase (GGDEF)-like protein/PAS domain S-box-containing protein